MSVTAVDQMSRLIARARTRRGPVPVEISSEMDEREVDLDQAYDVLAQLLVHNHGRAAVPDEAVSR